MTLRRTTTWLRRHFPTRTPVIVRVVKKLPDAHGYALIGHGRALIRIELAKREFMDDVLLEEWCHLLRHETPVPVEDEHDAIFWAILAFVTKKWRGE